jgi:signal transduction histidine kinase
MLAIGVLLLAAGTLGAWLLSRHVTRPLRIVTEAAEAVAAGDYAQRVDVRRQDELGRLGETFNAMATRIGESHDELAQRVEQSAALATELVQRNHELRLAQEETLRAVSRTDRLQSVTAALAAALDFDAVTTVLVTQGLAATSARAGVLFLSVDDGAALQLVRAEGYNNPSLAQWSRIPAAARVPVSEALNTGTAVYLRDEAEWTAHFGAPLNANASGYKAWAALPLTTAGRVIAVLGLSFATPQAFDRDTQAFLLALAQQCGQALDRAMLFDATVQARNAAEEARHAAQSANRAKSSFLAMMSHELRTPLNAIGGYAELLSLGLRGPVTPAQLDDLTRVRRNKDHLLAIINDILNLARIEAGQLDLNPTDVGISDMLADVEALIAPQVAAKGLRYDTSGCDTNIAVHADRERLQQVVLNIVSNAVRFTDPGGSVTVSCELYGDRVLLRVSDTGIGIPPDKLDAIFEPFVQVDAGLTRRTGGTGLGLAISRDMTISMGGTLSVKSEIGLGSTFTLDLPAAGAVSHGVRTRSEKSHA